MASYLLNDGAEWFIYVGDTYGDWTLYVDDQEAQIAPDAVRSRWYVTDHRPEQMELRHAPLSRAVAYRLPEGTQIEGLARELSADEFKEQFPRDEDYDYIDARAKLYEAVTESYVPDPKPVETPVLVLEGRPPDRDDTRVWVANLPYELRHRPEYLHLFPGYLVGFEEAFLAALERVPGVSSAHGSRAGEPVKVFYNLRYWPKPHRGRTLNGKRKDFQSVMKSLDLRPPRRIEGANRAEAEAKWTAEMERWLSEVREATTGCVCETCGGEFTPVAEETAVGTS